MVLELKVPHGDDLAALHPLIPVFLSYVLSFVYVGIYWNNHHLLHTVHRVTGGTLWAILLLLFWLSMVPFATGWRGENHHAAVPTALYWLVLLAAAASYYVLSIVIMRSPGPDSLLRKALGADLKGKALLVRYLTALAAAWWQPLVACGIYVLVAVIWLVPDRRIERVLAGRGAG